MPDDPATQDIPPTEPASPLDWDSLETEYVGGNMSLAALAELKTINLAALKARAHRGHWALHRQLARDRVNGAVRTAAAAQTAQPEAAAQSPAAEPAAPVIQPTQPDESDIPSPLVGSVERGAQLLVDRLLELNEQHLASAGELHEQIGRWVNAVKKFEKALPPDVIKTLASALATLQKVQRLALGAAVDQVALTGPSGGPVQTTNITLEELQEALRNVRNEF